jgi:hypothetical protein
VSSFTFICVCMYFLTVLGFELRASNLLDRTSNTQATLPSFFTLVILEIRSYFLPRLAWTMTLLFYTSYLHWDDRHIPLCPALFPLRWWSLKLFCRGCPGTMILPISALHIAGKTGVSHHAQLLFEMGYCKLPAQTGLEL